MRIEGEFNHLGDYNQQMNHQNQDMDIEHMM